MRWMKGEKKKVFRVVKRKLCGTVSNTLKLMCTFCTENQRLHQIRMSWLFIKLLMMKTNLFRCDCGRTVYLKADFFPSLTSFHVIFMSWCFVCCYAHNLLHSTHAQFVLTKFQFMLHELKALFELYGMTFNNNYMYTLNSSFTHSFLTNYIA